MYSKRIISVKDELDVDWQLVAADIDTSVHLLRYLHREEEWDSLKRQQFDALVEDIEKINGVECYSYNDYMILYEYMSEPVIIFSLADDKYVIFDVGVAKMIEKTMDGFCLI